MIVTRSAIPLRRSTVTQARTTRRMPPTSSNKRRLLHDLVQEGIWDPVGERYGYCGSTDDYSRAIHFHAFSLCQAAGDLHKENVCCFCFRRNSYCWQTHLIGWFHLSVNLLPEFPLSVIITLFSDAVLLHPTFGWLPGWTLPTGPDDPFPVFRMDFMCTLIYSVQSRLEKNLLFFQGETKSVFRNRRRIWSLHIASN